MRDRGNTQLGSGGGTECPDFEVLSHYNDDELNAAESESLGSHVAQCEPCSELLLDLRVGLAGAEFPRQRSIGASDCVQGELLLAHLTATLPVEAERALKKHLGSCDACVDLLAMLHRRLNVSAALDTPVPAAVKARAWSSIEASLPTPLRPVRPKIEPAGRRAEPRVSAWLRLPVLMPLSLAAGALLMVSIQETGLMSSTPRVMTRAVDREAHLRVTVPEVKVRQAPNGKAEVVAVVRRGTIVEIAGEDRDWLQVKLSDDRSGWVERDAFE
jgi:anti-sigma factor RsiW